MKVFNPISKDVDYRQSIFLAGPCPRKKEDFPSSWRNEAIDILKSMGFEGNVLNPENEQYASMGDDAYGLQTAWEQKGLAYASRILFWIPRSKEHPAFTANIEFGMWADSGKCVVGFPEDAMECRYVGLVCRKKSIPLFDSLRSAVEFTARNVESRTPDVFFTSDTHFGQSRTLSLSCRPFRSVEQMDDVIVSNWNRDVSMNDTVYHLGDFGDPEFAKLLNFKKMVLVCGNYERRDKSVVDRLSKDPRIVIVDEITCMDDDGNVYRLVHEPVSGKIDESDFCLFGHVHRTSVIKRNGINVGTDGNHFRLFSIDDVKWQRNGVLRHYDENVFTEVRR